MTWSRTAGRSHRAVVRAAGLLASLALGSGLALGHDFWIEPSDFEPPAESVLQVALRVGMRFEGDPVPRIASKISKFVLAGPGGPVPIEGRENQEPAGTARLGGPGVYVIGYRSLPSKIELEAPKFEAYLAEEGLEAIIASRARRGDGAKPGREIYSRCAKSIVAVGAAPADGGSGFDRPLGFTLELIPEKNPYALHAPGEMPVRILHEGKPLEGALVVAMSAGAPGRPVKVRSDAQGRAVFSLAPGIWLVKSVHMIPAPKDSGADWESLWASLTFEIPGSEAKPASD